VYFVDHSTKTTHWKDPRGPNANDPDLDAEGISLGARRLPCGWEPRHKVDGSVEYFNHLTGVTTDVDPRE